MGKGISTQISSLHFANKDQLTEHVRAIIGKYPVFSDVDDSDLPFLLALFEFHPDAKMKLESGIRRIEVRKDRFGNKFFQLFRNDGSDDDISWTWCVRNAK